MAEITVCIVDDNRELVHIMKDYFNEFDDIDVIGVAHDGEECLHLLDEVQPDILLLDVIMPRVDGLAVLQHLRKNDRMKQMSIIMLTAFGQEEVMRKAVEYGASYFILKPFDFEHLCDKIKEVYEQKTENEHELAYYNVVHESKV